MNSKLLTVLKWLTIGTILNIFISLIPTHNGEPMSPIVYFIITVLAVVFSVIQINNKD